MKDSIKNKQTNTKQKKINLLLVKAKSKIKLPQTAGIFKDKKNKNNETYKTKFNNWYLFPIIILFIVLITLTVYNTSIKQEIAELTPITTSSINLATYPYITNALTPQITAESALIYDTTSKITLFEKKPSLRFSMASTTKIMTALTALEHFEKTDVITIKNTYTEGAIIGFLPGEQLSFENMLYALLLPSANDAAYAIAENYPGGLGEFVAKMNKKASALKLNYTHYADPSGLDDDGNYTTTSDLAKLASYALTQKDFAKIIATKTKVISTIDGTNTYTINNLNKLLGENGVIGMKTGYTQGAGEVLVTAKKEKDHIFIIIVMKSEDRFQDTEVLLRYVSDNIKFINPGKYLLDNNK